MRMHARTLAAIARDHDLVSPAPGLFRCAVQIGDLVRGGTVLGELETLGQLARVVAPPGAHGAVTAVAERTLARPAVDYGAVLVTLDPDALAVAPGDTAAAKSAGAAATGLVFRAPTSGRFYGRPGPDKPAFVSAGDELTAGATVCLLEVMKTFHRVSYGGDAALPARARVRELLVRDGDDVNAGDPLLALDPL